MPHRGRDVDGNDLPRAVRDRLEALELVEEENRQLRAAMLPQVLPSFRGLRLTRSEHDLLHILREARSPLSKERIRLRYAAARHRRRDPDEMDVQLWRLEKKLATAGIRFTKEWGRSVSLADDAKAALAALVE